VPPSAEDPLVAQAFSSKNHEDLARAIEKLSSDEAAFFLHKLEHAIRKRKIQLTGYLGAMAAWLITMVAALVYFGTHDGFAYWVFVVPFGAVGLILYSFGRWAERVARTPYRPQPKPGAGAPDAGPAGDAGPAAKALPKAVAKP
jgi:hypothetical protein